jgi:hypothetical protein
MYSLLNEFIGGENWNDRQKSMTCCKSLTIFTTNINDLLQVTDNLYHKHQ